jgi:hypothetical protein
MANGEAQSCHDSAMNCATRARSFAGNSLICSMISSALMVQSSGTIGFWQAVLPGGGPAQNDFGGGINPLMPRFQAPPLPENATKELASGVGRLYSPRNPGN